MTIPTVTADGIEFRVHRGELTGIAHKADTIGKRIAELSKTIGGPSLDAATAHGGWEAGSALSQCATAWIGNIGKLGSQATDVGSKLHTSVQHYHEAEQRVIHHVRQVGGE
ncbi:hypothetical protein [Actinomadura violacea]|uniref:WXG100 family type VII secretion target n=1 Tax=Actinomadura violacea TaxID=2819934 RepID=A0ABS3RU01_9ACTN|nr:hypothetical protein [Actinomadura violacea]MBO2460235.1 hypothetical protein [Actinomadura violacea]